MSRRVIPTVEPPFSAEVSDVSVAGVLLAAGASSRFGDRNKLLATVDGETLVRRALAPLLDSSLDDIFVVAGHDADRVRSAVAHDDATVVENEDFDQGQSTSVRRGLAAVRDRPDDEPDAVFFALGDMPDVSPETVDLLVAAFASDLGDPLAAACDGNRGNPVVFGRRYFDRLADLSGDTGGRDILLDAEDARLVETGDPGVLRDVDAADDL